MLWLADRSMDPMVTLIGCDWNACASFCTVVGQVAENMSVWRSERMVEQMARMCGSNPRSSMRSASSRTRYVTAWGGRGAGGASVCVGEGQQKRLGGPC